MGHFVISAPQEIRRDVCVCTDSTEYFFFHAGINCSCVIMPLHVLATRLTGILVRERAVLSMRHHYSHSARHHDQTLRNEQQNSYGKGIPFRHKATEYIARISAKSETLAFLEQAAASNHGPTRASRETTK